MDRCWNAKNMLTIILLLFLQLFINHAACQKVVKQSLDGPVWSAFDNEKEYIVNASVPGSIYSDLKNAGIIGDIYRDMNDVKYRWVSQRNWTFERFFNADPGLASKSEIYLTAHGLDTVGEIYFNNRLLGAFNNQFVRYRWPIKDLLLFNRPNLIVIHFESAQNYALEKFLQYPFLIPPTGPPPAQKGEGHANFIRKMQSSFSWDWGPAFPTQGIWKSIELEAYNDFLWRDITVNTVSPTIASNGRWQVSFLAYFDCKPGSIVQGKMDFELANVSYPSASFYRICDQKSEAIIDGALFMPPDIELWYPNGVGHPKLYDFGIKLTGTEGDSQKKNIRIGFRTVEIRQERLNSSAEAYSFVFYVNGRPIYAKGSNWIPAHVLQESISEAYLQDLLISAKLANMNMLRVWGGGVYETDRFYQLADELGILIWQDLMFACALYPVDKPFLDSVKTEVRQNIRRLQYHPSIALWAGNNENEVALADIWWLPILQNRLMYLDDYRELYIRTIEPIVRQEDGRRPYLSSSPSNGIVDARENYTAARPNSEAFGDVHHYTVTGDVWNWKRHPSAKFVSEYGFQSWSSLETISSVLSPEYLKYPLTPEMEHRQHQTDGSEYIRNMVEENFILPNGNESDALEKFIYLTQVHQAMAIKLQTEYYRRNRAITEHGTGNTMGALYWQLNDIWPTVSWSSIEYGGKWKMLHYYAQKMFDNTLVDAFIDNDMLMVALTRDQHDSGMMMNVSVLLYKWNSNTPIWQQNITTFSQPFSSMIVYSESLSRLLESNHHCPTPGSCVVHVRATDNDGTVDCDNFLLLDAPKNSTISNSVTIVNTVSGPFVENGLAKYVIDIEAINGVAAFVWLEIDSSAKIFGLFSENGFFIFDKRTIVFQTLAANVPGSKIAQALRIKTLMDYYR